MAGYDRPLHDLTPCPRLDGSRVCMRSLGASRCHYCGRDLPMSHPTVIEDRVPEGQVVAAPRHSVISAARRIKRALYAEADRVAGIDTSHLGGSGPMPAGRLAWFREQARSALSLREADELIEALPELLDEVDRLRALASPAAPGDAAPTTFALALSYDPAISPVVLEHCLACGMTLGQLPGGGRTCVRCDVDDEGTDG